MKIDILLATMFFENEDDNFLDEMNIQTDIVVGNQCDITKDERYTHRGHNVTVLSRNERGVGKNRNLALFHSDADIVLFADNDIRYYDGYREIIEKSYKEHPDADMIIFNFRKKCDDGWRNTNTKNKKARLKDITRYGAPTITAKRESLLKNRICFSLLFGGGAKYSCGEDSLFLTDCYNKGLNIYLCSETLGENIQRESTWFTGINEKFIFDKGVLFGAMCPKTYRFVICFHSFKHRKRYSQYATTGEVIKLMLKGAKEYRNHRI